MSSGRSTADVLTDTLSAPTRSSRRASSTVRMPPPIVNGMNTCSATRLATSTIVSRASGRRGDVEEHELVGALGVVAGGQLHRVAGVDEVDEVHALHDAPRVDVEARDDAGGPHDALRQRGDGLGHVDAALVDRGADDGPGEAPAAALDAGERQQVGQRRRRRRRR